MGQFWEVFGKFQTWEHLIPGLREAHTQREGGRGRVRGEEGERERERERDRDIKSVQPPWADSAKTRSEQPAEFPNLPHQTEHTPGRTEQQTQDHPTSSGTAQVPVSTDHAARCSSLVCTGGFVQPYVYVLDVLAHSEKLCFSWEEASYMFYLVFSPFTML